MNKDTQHFQQACGFLAQWALSPEQALQNQSPRLVFSHVPKTAGTTLETIIAKNYRLSDVLHLNAPEFNRYPEILSLKKNPPRFICGHHPLHSPLYRHLPAEPLFHFTMLREPVARVVSYYNYLRGKSDHPLHQQASSQSIEDFVQSKASPELNNGQARRFSGYLHQPLPNDESFDETLFETAREALTSGFSLIGTTDRFDETLLLLNNYLGLPDLYYQRRNQSTKTISTDNLSPKAKSIIETNNQADMHLYRFAKVELNKLIKKHLSAERIQRFKTNNQRYIQLLSPTTSS